MFSSQGKIKGGPTCVGPPENLTRELSLSICLLSPYLTWTSAFLVQNPPSSCVDLVFLPISSVFLEPAASPGCHLLSFSVSYSQCFLRLLFQYPALYLPLVFQLPYGYVQLLLLALRSAFILSFFFLGFSYGSKPIAHPMENAWSLACS